MKKLITLFALAQLFIINLIAQSTTLKMLNKSIAIEGERVSNIKLVNYANTTIGNLYTHTIVTKTIIVFSQYKQYKKEGVEFICIQKITASATFNLIPDITVQKSFVDPEMKTNPKQCWDVSVAFKQKNGEYVDVGIMEEYRISYEGNSKKVVKESFTGTSRVVPFASKIAAEDFVKKLKESLKN